MNFSSIFKAVDKSGLHCPDMDPVINAIASYIRNPTCTALDHVFTSLCVLAKSRGVNITAWLSAVTVSNSTKTLDFKSEKLWVKGIGYRPPQHFLAAKQSELTTDDIIHWVSRGEDCGNSGMAIRLLAEEALELVSSNGEFQFADAVADCLFVCLGNYYRHDFVVITEERFEDRLDDMLFGTIDFEEDWVIPKKVDFSDEKPKQALKHHSLLVEASTLMQSKGMDYNSNGVAITDYFQRESDHVYSIRNKYLRLESLLGSETTSHESKRDTLVDMVNYCTFYADYLEQKDSV